MMGTAVMDWLRAHVIPHHKAELPLDVREAAHRISSESSMIRSEVVQALGGPAAYYREAKKIADVAAMLRGPSRTH